MSDAPRDPDHLDIASEETEKRFEEKMTEIDLKQKESLIALRAEELGLRYINLANFPIEQETLALLPKEQAMDLQMIPFLFRGKEIRVGIVNPEQPGLAQAIEDLEAVNRATVKQHLISPHSFREAVKQYDRLPKIQKVVAGVEITEEDINRYRTKHPLENFGARLKKVPLTEVFTMILAGAIDADATDVHIEPEESDVKVRYRIDGVLRDVAELPKDLWPRVLSRVKLLAKLKLNVTNRPQDGRITLLLTGEDVDVRVSTLPTSYGESITMRLLMGSAARLDLEELGLRGDTFERLKRQIVRPNGLLVTSGPTGSGKTTTLYAILNHINNEGTKIVTLEDPIEYKLEGVSQSQVDAGKGYTFAKGLRSILRQDPDIIMVGEIRDLETAEIAVQATLTGHLVLSTIHTNSAAAGIPRFLAMGVKPFLLGPALNGVMSQRLLRKLCERCRAEAQLQDEERKRVQDILAGLPEEVLGYEASPTAASLTFYEGKGCSECGGTGFRGRTGIFELLEMNEDIERMLSEQRISESVIHKSAVEHGMLTMVQDGILKALEGITSVDEVFRVAVED